MTIIDRTEHFQKIPADLPQVKTYMRNEKSSGTRRVGWPECTRAIEAEADEPDLTADNIAR